MKLRLSVVIIVRDAAAYFTACLESARFADEIVPITVTGEGGETVVTQDGGIRPDSSVEKLATLKPAFRVAE